MRFGLQVALLILFFWFPLLLGMLFSPAVGCVLLRLDTSLSLCSAYLLLVVVQVLRFCAPFRQSGFASFVNFFSSLALLAVILSLFSVFWRRLLQHYFVVVYCSEVRLLHLQRHHSTCVTSWSLVRSRCSGSSTLQFTTTWSAACEDWFRFRTLLSVSMFTDCVHTLM